MGGITLDDFTQSVADREIFGRGHQESPAAAPKMLRSARVAPGDLGQGTAGF